MLCFYNAVDLGAEGAFRAGNLREGPGQADFGNSGRRNVRGSRRATGLNLVGSPDVPRRLS